MSVDSASGIIRTIRSVAREGEFERAEQLARRHFGHNSGTPEALEALSWVARAALQTGRLSQASDYARQVHRSVLRRLRAADLDSQRRLPASLGASIEVLAQVAANRGDHARAIRFLRHELARFGATSIRFRIRKNLNLLTLEGHPAPELEIAEWIGRKPPLLQELAGRPILLFFWAHYCEDSRAQGDVLVRIRDEFGGDLAFIGPTRRYGFLDEQGRRPVGPKQEVAHIREVLARYYADLLPFPIPVAECNFEIYGVSTTPTLTIVDSNGVVSLYHPGKLAYRELVAVIRAELNPRLRHAHNTRTGM